MSHEEHVAELLSDVAKKQTLCWEAVYALETALNSRGGSFEIESAHDREDHARAERGQYE